MSSSKKCYEALKAERYFMCIGTKSITLNVLQEVINIAAESNKCILNIGIAIQKDK